MRMIQHNRHRRSFRIEREQAFSKVRNEDPAVAMNLQAIGLAIIFSEYTPFSRRRNLENSCVSEVDTEQIAVPIEGWSFEKRMQRPGSAMCHPIRMRVGLM